MSHRNLVIITKIILFYSIFVVIMKAIFLVQQYLNVRNEQEAEIFNALALAHLILVIPFVILAIVAFFKTKKENYAWPFVIVGAIVIIGIRAFEVQLLGNLQNYFLS